MSSRVLRRGCFCAAIAAGFLGPCQAAPIQLGDLPPSVDAGHSGSTARAGTSDSSAASAPLPYAVRTGTGAGVRESFELDADDRLLAQERAGAAASARDPELVPIDMQGATVQAHPANPAHPKNALPDPANDSTAIKRLAVAARDWVHDVFPSLSDKPPDGARPGVPTASRDDLALPVETQSNGMRALAPHVERAAEVGNAGTALPHAAAAVPSAETPTGRMMADSAPEYSIQRALKLSREVLAHPLTWLTIALIGVGHIAVSRGRK